MNKWYIGQRVYDEEYGVGVVDDIILTDNFPIKVEFNGYYETYTLDGKVFSFHDDISLFTTKKGTPEARRIVAMLARRYRSSVIKDWKKANTKKEISIKSIYKSWTVSGQVAYKTAKAMLGE